MDLIYQKIQSEATASAAILPSAVLATSMWSEEQNPDRVPTLYQGRAVG
jgi:hypothetical protein